MNYKVYLLFHKNYITEKNIDTKDIGLFDSYLKANCAIAYLSDQVGFNESLDGFRIIRIKLDKTYWLNGFKEFIGPNHLPKNDTFSDSDTDLALLNLNKVYYLTHYFEWGEGIDHEDRRVIGVYSTKAKMNEAIQFLSTKSGFRDYKDKLEGETVIVNNFEWKEGFINWNDI